MILSSRGPLGIGETQYDEWHKEEHDNLMRDVCLEVRPIVGGDLRRRRTKDHELHTEMVRLRSQKHGRLGSMRRGSVGALTGRGILGAIE